jgi:hypothetical protein
VSTSRDSSSDSTCALSSAACKFAVSVIQVFDSKTSSSINPYLTDSLAVTVRKRQISPDHESCDPPDPPDRDRQVTVSPDSRQMTPLRRRRMATNGVFAPIPVNGRIDSLDCSSEIAAIQVGFPAVVAGLSVTEWLEVRGACERCTRVRRVTISEETTMHSTEVRPRADRRRIATEARAHGVCQRWPT